MPDVTWNPWHGCRKLSAGCKNCYVYREDAAYGRDASAVTRTSMFDLPVKKGRGGEYKIPSGATVYTCFSSDFFLEEADAWRSEAWRMMRARGDLAFVFITKRIDRAGACLPEDWGEGYPNVSLGCTCENQNAADYRLPLFRAAPAQKRFVVCEPLLERIDLSPHLGPWFCSLVVGGESGEGARECLYDWVLDIRGQCEAANVPFGFKQTGANFVKDGKRYRIERKYQHAQAKKAGIDLF